MTRRELDRIRLVTRDFRGLQGLRTLVPMGLGFVGLGLGCLAFCPQLTVLAIGYGWAKVRAALILAGAFVLALVLVYLVVLFHVRAGAYYRRLFGDVEERPQSFSLSSVGVIAGAALLLMVIGVVGKNELLVPFTMYAAALILYWLARGRRLYSIHHLLLGLLLLAIAGSPWFVPSLRLSTEESMIVVGLVYILAGLLDHRLLVQELHPHRGAACEAAGDDLQSQEARR